MRAEFLVIGKSACSRRATILNCNAATVLRSAVERLRNLRSQSGFVYLCDTFSLLISRSAIYPMSASRGFISRNRHREIPEICTMPSDCAHEPVQEMEEQDRTVPGRSGARNHHRQR